MDCFYRNEFSFFSSWIPKSRIISLWFFKHVCLVLSFSMYKITSLKFLPFSSVYIFSIYFSRISFEFSFKLFYWKMRGERINYIISMYVDVEEAFSKGLFGVEPPCKKRGVVAARNIPRTP